MRVGTDAHPSIKAPFFSSQSAKFGATLIDDLEEFVCLLVKLHGVAEVEVHVFQHRFCFEQFCFVLLLLFFVRLEGAKCILLLLEEGDEGFVCGLCFGRFCVHGLQFKEP